MAATNINRVIITGNLTADPELRSLPSGTSVCKLRVACNTRRKDGATGEWVDKPNYFDVTVWGAQGENCARYLSKGRPRRHRRPPGVARVGERGGQASARRSTSSPTPSSSSAAARRGRRRRQQRRASPRSPTSRSTRATSPAAPAGGSARRRTTTFRSRRPQVRRPGRTARSCRRRRRGDALQAGHAPSREPARTARRRPDRRANPVPSTLCASRAVRRAFLTP